MRWDRRRNICDWYCSCIRLRRGGALHSNRLSAAKIQDEDPKNRRRSLLMLLAGLKASSISSELQSGKAMHIHAIESGMIRDIYIASSLVDMFAKCGSMADARAVFNEMPCRNVVSWTALILGYAENGQGEIALSLFHRMVRDKDHQEGGHPKPNSRTFVAAIKACASLSVQEQGKQAEGKLVKLESLQSGMIVHSQAAHLGCDLDIFVANSLIDMYGKCGSVGIARKVFDTMPCHNVVSWNALMLGYADNGEERLALTLFEYMCEHHQEGLSFAPNRVSVLVALKACGNLAAREPGQMIDGRLVKVDSLATGIKVHAQAVKAGCGLDTSVGNSLVDMYAKCRSIEDAQKVFDRIPSRSVVSWNALMLGYVENGQAAMTLDLFHRMQQEFQERPNRVSYLAVLKACSSLGMLENAKQVDGKLVKVETLEKGIAVHSQAVKSGFDSDSFVRSSLIDMYATCGSMVQAHKVFFTGERSCAVLWNALMLGYVENGEAQMALELFERMKIEGCAPDGTTFLAQLLACGSAAALEAGKSICAVVCRQGLLHHDAAITTAVVDFYAKCGSLIEAKLHFDSIDFSSSKNNNNNNSNNSTVCWTALIGGYGRQGDTGCAFEMFRKMQQENVAADGVTFLCLLTACSHAGLVGKAKTLFQTMRSSRHGLTPSIEHYHCMVDVLGRANQIEEAVDMVKSVPYGPSAVAWMTVLAACRKWGNVQVGKLAFDSVVELDPRDVAAYSLMSSIYSRLGMWEEQMQVEGLRRKAGAWLKPGGRSWWTDCSGVVHMFDSNHDPQVREELQEGLKIMMARFRFEEQEHIALDSFGEQDDEQVQNHDLCGHSEKLAVACALINTAQGTTIRIIKDARVCEDCHEAISIISKLEQRRILCRDTSRFHIFTAGLCSCGGFW